MKKYIVLFFAFFVFAACHGFALSQPAASFQSSDGVYVGVFREGAPKNMGYIKSFEKQFKIKPAMVMWYEDYSSDFPADGCKNVVQYGATPHIVWEPWIWGEEDKIKLDNIINGDWDKYIERWAKNAKEFGKTVFVRWGHEFNIEKYPWGVGNNGKDPEKYIKAYRHVHDIFKKAGATNVKWIWCFNNYPNPDEAWNDWELAYPGDEYVDWIGIDGYNWGTTQTWSGWQSFKEMFRDQIRATASKHPKKPVMIAEFGSAEEGGNKALWIKDIPDTLKINMKQVKSIVLFDVKKECDWRATSCQQTEDAYRKILADPYFLISAEALNTLTMAEPKAAKRTVLAKKARKTIKIDGNFDAFAHATPIVMDSNIHLQEGSSWKGPKDLSANIYMLWDDANLYMYAKVTDNFPQVNSKTNGDIWNGDGIEVTVPGYQIGFGAGDGMANKPSIWIWQKKKASIAGEIFVQKTSDPKGYILEAKVPWRELGFIVPKPNEKIGFDIALDDADETWQRKAQFVWNGDYLFYKDPDVWGELKFEN